MHETPRENGNDALDLELVFGKLTIYNIVIIISYYYTGILKYICIFFSNFQLLFYTGVWPGDVIIVRTCLRAIINNDNNYWRRYPSYDHNNDNNSIIVYDRQITGAVNGGVTHDERYSRVWLTQSIIKSVYYIIYYYYYYYC